ncbi:recombinase family protein [soil metagenome]
MLEAIKTGEVDTIICWHTDRLYRRVRDLVELVELAEKHSLKILTVKGGDLDLNNATGRMMAQIMGAVARQEVEHKGERQKVANLERAKQGVRHFGNRPYGYERVDGDVRIVETEAAVLREAINRFIAGESWYSIARDFRNRGIVGISGRPFSYQNLRLRAANPALAGVRTYLGDVVNEEGLWAPIIDRATWERFQGVLTVRTQQQGWDKKIKYLGSGLYVCGKCGGSMKVSRDWGKSHKGPQADHPPVYRCANLDMRRRLEPVDELVEAAIIERLSQPDVLRLLSPSEDVSALAAESQELRLRIDGLASLYADGTLTGAAVRSEKAKLQSKLDALQTRIASAEGGAVINALATAIDVGQYWHESMSLQNKRRILEALVTVTIQPTKRGGTNAFSPEDVTIDWRS